VCAELTLQSKSAYLAFNGEGKRVEMLTYTYAGNRLTNVRDNAAATGTGDFRDNGQTGTGTEFTYDANGNAGANHVQHGAVAGVSV